MVQRVKTTRHAEDRERNMAFWTSSFPSHRASSPPGSHVDLEHLEKSSRDVARSEWIVAGWRELIDRMQADGHDVTVARDLLEAFQSNLEAHRSKRDQIQQAVAEGRR